MPDCSRGSTFSTNSLDRKVIPGVAIEVLADRLELGICICGEELEARQRPLRSR